MIVTVFALALTGVWLSILIRAAIYGSVIQNLLDIPYTPLSSFPKLSIILTGRDECETMKDSIPKLLASNYPRLEFILANDRSTDGTGELIDAFAKTDPRLKPVHITALPDGWLGKVHALCEAEKLSTGDWLLFTDADIHFERDLLERTVSYAEQNGLDHLSILPERFTHKASYLITLFETAFGTLFVQKAYVPNLSDPKKKDFIGVGAFNLVRRSAFERTAGFEGLRMEVLDDVGVGYLIKSNGGRSGLFYGKELLLFEWYPTLALMIKGLEKNLFAGIGRYSYFRMIRFLLGLLILVLAPLILGIIAQSPLVLIVVSCVYVVFPAIVATILYAKLKISPLIMGTLPLGYLFLVYAGFRSMLAAFRLDGISWRGTRYPLSELRKNQVVKF